MMIKVGGGIVDIEGKSGGDVYRKDVCGQHIQSYPREYEHQFSPAQAQRRRSFAKLTEYMKSHATIEFAATWQDYANRHKKTNKKGEAVGLTWWQQFIGYNINGVVAGNPIIELPP